MVARARTVGGRQRKWTREAYSGGTCWGESAGLGDSPERSGPRERQLVDGEP